MPPPAHGMLGEHAATMRAYAALLAGPGVQRGLIGPREVPRLWERHLLNCAAVGELIPTTSAVADVGSGAGLPGIVLAVLRPDLEVTLVEPLLRRASFLTECVAELELANAVVVRERAEHFSRTHPARFDVVTARAVAPLERLVGWCLPLVKPQGVLLAIKGASAAAELAGAHLALRRAGATRSDLCHVGGPEHPTTVIRVVREGSRRRGRSRARS